MQVQIPKDLLLALFQYHLAGNEDYLPEIEKALMEKLDEQGKPILDKDGKPLTEEKTVQIPAFKVVSVFDVSQTEGEPLPSIAVNELSGSVQDYQDFFRALEQASPVPIGFEDIEGGAHGYFHLLDNRIAIQEGMSQLQTIKTAIHEIAHAKLHAIDPNDPEQTNRPDSRTREVQAESVAYAVCQHYGLDTSEYSFGYVAGWSSGRELAELKAWIHVDYDDDDNVIQMIYDAVIEEMTELIPDFDSTSMTARQRLLTCVYVKELYDNREQMENKKSTMRYAIQSMLLKEMLN